ncbi:uncharacterized protein N7484_010286 [Penicillium longicatenatum]|uniref:uncharacterized protein n=1 Tax=Penicillium longicatenatum TaxID=1561947 RepID=UPI002549AC19|nr:uncharacterized protein N7484_010286 [Penicillium longicatenatum]KAJ5630186.1 hypothetical protein N7484_010286 [Penicillium longicatenatum]
MLQLVHLKCGGFRRDYGLDDPTVDKQAAHGSWVAGTVYARGLKEAPGAIEGKRMRFRGISLEWHKFLGFEAPVARKRRYSQIGNGDEEQAWKHRQEYITIAISDDE